jgi:hypothetical protein
MTALDTRPSAFGALVAACHVETMIVEQLRKWLTTYLAEVDRAQGQPVGTLPAPRSYVVSSDPEKMPEDQTPTVMVVSPGMTDPPQADGQGRFTARWQVNVGVQLAARGNALALRLARLEALAIRAVLVQQQTYDTLAVRRIEWLGERYDELDSIDDRTVCVALVELAVEISDVTTRHAGPLEPLLAPEAAPGPDSPAWPTAVIADVDVHKRA